MTAMEACTRAGRLGRLDHVEFDGQAEVILCRGEEGIAGQAAIRCQLALVAALDPARKAARRKMSVMMS